MDGANLSARNLCQVFKRVKRMVDLDLEKFFDRVDHDRPMGQIAKRVHDKRLLRLIRNWLKAGVLENGLAVVPRSLNGTLTIQRTEPLANGQSRLDAPFLISLQTFDWYSLWVFLQVNLLGKWKEKGVLIDIPAWRRAAKRVR